MDIVFKDGKFATDNEHVQDVLSNSHFCKKESVELKNKNMDNVIQGNKIIIEKVNEQLLTDKERMRLCEIRFDCLVKMYDFGSIETKGGMFLTPSKNLPPQWFRLLFDLSLEAIEYGSEQEIGYAVKSAYLKLKKSIEEYEHG